MKLIFMKLQTTSLYTLKTNLYPHHTKEHHIHETHPIKLIFMLSMTEVQPPSLKKRSSKLHRHIHPNLIYAGLSHYHFEKNITYAPETHHTKPISIS